jgi:type I restriction enzyme R subunit
VRIIDWEDPGENDFLLVNQLWVTGDMYTRRPDAVGFVNGIPLILFEFKKPSEHVRHAFDDNLRDYKDTIPQLLWYNAFIVLSNGSDTRIGTISSAWEHFSEWKKINDEGEEGVVSLETMLRGTCDPVKLLDIVENFLLFSELQGGLKKLLAKNHQYLGVNNAIRSVQEIKNNQGRLGVFWHTQGSGKSYSMLFFSQKVLRKLTGNWSFVIVTDRLELDDQIYKNFANAGVLTEEQCQAESGEHLKQLLQEDHRFIFTLIHKFRTDDDSPYPKLSDRDDIIVMTDEAHRSQYDTLAMNMRNALPNAAFIGFTGTPLIAGEEKTRDVFGDYVSVYDFKQSVEDNATVPLYYENRIPELELVNEALDEDLEKLLEKAALDEVEERKLAREFSREYHLITRDDRLDAVAEDIVEHFVHRGYRGKGMVISIDKATAVKMYDKVKACWDRKLAALKASLREPSRVNVRFVEDQIDYMEAVDMAVVVSSSQNEVAEFRARGLDIATHRKRMVTEDLETKFKDPDDPLSLVFLCAMWTTGFDVPCCSTIYLDKPMKNHTLMQTIARANRVFGDKVSGLIVDYVGIFRNLQKALAIYGQGRGGEPPVRSKEELIELLRREMAKMIASLEEMGVSLDGILNAKGFTLVNRISAAVDTILADDETKKAFVSQANHINRLYKAILPDPSAAEFAKPRKLLMELVKKIRSIEEYPVDISEVIAGIEHLLDESVAPVETINRESNRHFDLSTIDFDALSEKFKKRKQHTDIQKLRAAVEKRLQTMLEKNRSRLQLYERYEDMIAEYNAGSKNIEDLFRDLMKFAQDLDEEEKRHLCEGLSEEELALFDLLTQPEPKLNKKEEAEVKKVVRELLEKLQQEKLVLDWRKKQQSRAAVKLCIEETLDLLPSTYTKQIYETKCAWAFQHIYDNYYGAGQSLYAKAG